LSEFIPRARYTFLISWFVSIFSCLDFSTLSIFPLSGSIACILRFLPCFAEPPAESPSTIKSSQRLGSLSWQSANFPGNIPLSRRLLFFISSFAFFAASLALFASRALFIIALATSGFNSKYSVSLSLRTDSTRPLISLFPSLALVCPSNCGFCIFILMTATRPSLKSSPDIFSLDFWDMFVAIKLFILLVRALLKPATCVPPSCVFTLFTKL